MRGVGGLTPHAQLQFQALFPSHVAWYPAYAMVAASGDVGYTWGYYRWTSRNDKGAPAPPVDGKYLTIWRRDGTGTSKAVVDTGNQGPVPANFFDRANREPAAPDR